MVSDFIKDRLNTAHAFIDEGKYDVAVEILKNIKLRIHEKEAEEEIAKFEEEKDARKNIKLEEIKKSDDDELRKDANKYETWALYAKNYLNFYDKLSQRLL